MLSEKITEFIEYRKAIKKPLKEASQKSFLKRLTKLSNGDENEMIEILDQSIANGWQGIFEIRKEKIKPNKITESNNILNNLLFNINNGSI